MGAGAGRLRKPQHLAEEAQTINSPHRNIVVGPFPRVRTAPGRRK